MKKRFVVGGCLAIAVIVSLFSHPNQLRASALHAETELSHWADTLVRQPNDPHYHTFYYDYRKSCFAVELALPHPATAVVFLGDSMTDEGNWTSYFSEKSVINFGIGGDTTTGILNRLDQVIDAKPKKIFLMIGTNDLCYNRAIPDIMTNYRRILTRLHQQLPDTQLYIQSVLPFNEQIFPSNGLRSNANILLLNREIRRMAREFNDPYIDMVPAFSNPDGRLPAELTSDGLHLNRRGYQVWQKQIESRV